MRPVFRRGETQSLGYLVTLARLQKATEYSAYMVEQFGDQYAWIFDRLSGELDAIRRKHGLDEVQMPRTPAKVTQADISRAIRAMRDAGYSDVRVVFKDGAVIVEAAPKGSRSAPDPTRIIEL